MRQRSGLHVNLGASTSPANQPPQTTGPLYTVVDGDGLKMGDIAVIVYDQGWWVGEVTNIPAKKEYMTRFMVESGGKFTWSHDKVEHVHDNFILDSRPELVACDSSLRFFELRNRQVIVDAYNSYCDRYY